MDKRISQLEKRVESTEKQLKQVGELQVKLQQQLSSLREDLNLLKTLPTEKERKKAKKNKELRSSVELQPLDIAKPKKTKSKDKMQREESKSPRKKANEEEPTKKKRSHSEENKFGTVPRSRTAPTLERQRSVTESNNTDLRLQDLSNLLMYAEIKRDQELQSKTPRKGPQGTIEVPPDMPPPPDTLPPPQLDENPTPKPYVRPAPPRRYATYTKKPPPPPPSLRRPAPPAQNQYSTQPQQLQPPPPLELPPAEELNLGPPPPPPPYAQNNKPRMIRAGPGASLESFRDQDEAPPLPYRE